MANPVSSSLSDAPWPRFRLVETSFGDLPGFADDDHLAAWTVFLRSARAIAEGRTPLRPARDADAALHHVCRAALSRPDARSSAEARRAFEDLFVPHRVEADEPGFLTCYYEPEVEGSLERTPDFTAPILARPKDLGRIGPGVAEHPYSDRAEIEARSDAGAHHPVVWLRDVTEVFVIHVQGSARVRLPDGRMLRLVYDGRNGQPYTSIGRQLIERGEIAPEAMSLDALKTWLRHNGQAIGEPARALMQSNRSYIFFRAEPDVPGEGPIGGAGVPLSRLRSIAIDRTLWSYGLPFFIEANLPWRTVEAEPFRQLMVAQDTGSAILGPARGDLYCGSGLEAGRRAGDIRHPAAFTVLCPMTV